MRGTLTDFSSHKPNPQCLALSQVCEMGLCGIYLDVIKNADSDENYSR